MQWEIRKLGTFFPIFIQHICRIQQQIPKEALSQQQLVQPEAWMLLLSVQDLQGSYICVSQDQHLVHAGFFHGAGGNYKVLAVK